jgi:hypothetical protein
MAYHRTLAAANANNRRLGGAGAHRIASVLHGTGAKTKRAYKKSKSSMKDLHPVVKNRINGMLEAAAAGFLLARTGARNGEEREQGS